MFEVVKSLQKSDMLLDSLWLFISVVFTIMLDDRQKRNNIRKKKIFIKKYDKMSDFAYLIGLKKTKGMQINYYSKLLLILVERL